MKILILTLIVLLSQCCSSTKNKNKAEVSDTNEISMDYSAGPPINIYKTKKDYSKNVAVSLSEDKMKIVSYPHPSDVYYKGQLAYPTILDKDYLLDNLGININVAFLSISLEQYSKYSEVPSLKELYGLIIDKDPLTELYYCGNRHNLKDEIVEINKIINDGQLTQCKCLTKE